MGATKLSLTQFELNQPENIYLKLTDPARPLKDLGEIKIVVTLMPKTQEDKEQVNVRNHPVRHVRFCRFSTQFNAFSEIFSREVFHF
jgi:hypothetical protein